MRTKRRLLRRISELEQEKAILSELVEIGKAIAVEQHHDDLASTEEYKVRSRAIIRELAECPCPRHQRERAERISR